MFGRWLRKTTPASPPAGPAEPTNRFRSPGLAAVVDELERRPSEELALLDLGPASNGNVRYFSGLCSRVYVNDLYAALQGPSRRDAAMQVGSGEESATFDAIIAWDLLNYLDPSELSSVLCRLAILARPRAVLFALVGYRSEIPDRPMLFQIQGDGDLEYEEEGSHRRAAPRHSARDLGLALPGFETLGSYLLQNGYREFVFQKSDETHFQVDA